MEKSIAGISTQLLTIIDHGFLVGVGIEGWSMGVPQYEAPVLDSERRR